MFKQITKAVIEQGQKTAGRSAALALVVRDTINGFMTTTHHAVMILGVGAIAALALMFVKPDVTDHLKALSPFTRVAINEEAPIAVSSALDTPSKVFATAPAGRSAGLDTSLADFDLKRGHSTQEQEWVAKWISKRYRVANDATHVLVAAAYKTADELELDPLLILAVAAIESGFNPFAESAMGAQGLMQVMSKVHQDKFRQHGGVKAALNPVTNIKVGALILKDYVRRGGSVEAGLKMYVGAAAFETDSGYGVRVLNEYRRLKEVAAGRNVPVSTTASKAAPKGNAVSTDTEPKAAPADEDKSASLQTAEAA